MGPTRSHSKTEWSAHSHRRGTRVHEVFIFGTHCPAAGTRYKSSIERLFTENNVSESFRQGSKKAELTEHFAERGSCPEPCSDQCRHSGNGRHLSSHGAATVRNVMSELSDSLQLQRMRSDNAPPRDSAHSSRTRSTPDVKSVEVEPQGDLKWKISAKSANWL
eukprot:998217-Rhodomonas_salina.1